MLRRHPHPRTQPSVHRPPTQRPRAPPTAPSGPGAPHAPAAPTEPQGWAQGGAERARATLEQVAQRGLGTERVNPVRGHRSASAPSPKFGLHRRPAAHPEKAPRHALHSAAPKTFVLAATRITIPEEEVPRLLVALPHRVRPRSGQPRRHLLSPHSRVLFPLSRTGRGLHDPGLTSHLGAGLPGGCGAGRGRPQVPQVNAAARTTSLRLGATTSFRDGRSACARRYGAGALRTLGLALLF